jgi:DNA polymerase III subunit epsilon
LADTNQSAIRIVAHNIQFDARIIGVEAQRAGLQFSFEGRFIYCTMMNTVKVCCIPKRGGGHKWPSLLELHQHLFGLRFNEAHDARHDVRATADCFFELRKRDLLKFDA